MWLLSVSQIWIRSQLLVGLTLAFTGMIKVVQRFKVHAELRKDLNRPPECVLENYFLYFSSKTYVVGTQKNGLNETVLLTTQNTCLN